VPKLKQTNLIPLLLYQQKCSIRNV